MLNSTSKRSHSKRDVKGKDDKIQVTKKDENGEDNNKIHTRDIDNSTNNNDDDNKKMKKKKRKNGNKRRIKASGSSNNRSNYCTFSSNRRMPSINGKQIVAIIMFTLIATIMWDTTMTPPEERFIKPDAADNFLLWVQENHYKGLGAFLIVIAICVIIMLPIGTPLTLGCGYIYKGAYGWYIGVAIATAVSMAGSALGAVCCFLLGRYLMRERVQKWSRKYPLFDAIDIAVSEQGFKIMAMLYLTPVLPLGPISYMCGTTAMPLSSFALAKVASTPLMLLYVFIGASMGHLVSSGGAGGSNKNNISRNAKAMVPDDAIASSTALVVGEESNHNEMEEIENNKTLIILGILLSFTTITIISHYIKKELYKIFERQKKEGTTKKTKKDIQNNDNDIENNKNAINNQQHKDDIVGNNHQQESIILGENAGNGSTATTTTSSATIELGGVAARHRIRQSIQE